MAYNGDRKIMIKVWGGPTVFPQVYESRSTLSIDLKIERRMMEIESMRGTRANHIGIEDWKRRPQAKENG